MSSTDCVQPKSPPRIAPRLTRGRLRAVINAVILDSDLLHLILPHASICDLTRAAQACTAWNLAAAEALRSWRRTRGLYVCGGCCGGTHPANSRALASLQRYDPLASTPESSWVPMADMNQARDHLGCAAVNARVYAVGGWTGSRNLSSVEVYEPASDKWLQAPDMSVPRSGHGVAADDCGETLFAVGGWGGAGDYLASVEALSISRLSPLGLHWVTLPAELETPRHCPGVAYFDGHLYATGGMSGYGHSHLDSIERLDPERVEEGWQSAAPMLAPRYRHALVTLGKFLYAIGGESSGQVVIASVERYNPALQQWQLVAPLAQPRMSHAVSVVHGCIYIAGGYDGSNWLSSFERYDPDKDVWEVVTELDSPARCATGVAFA